MRLEAVRWSGVVGTVIAGVVGALTVVAPSSAAAASDWWCHGAAVERCATVWWDEVADTFRARAKITDVSGGGNYEVRVIDVKLQRTSSSGAWVTLRTKADGDGWHDTEDLAGTTTVDPCNYPRQSYSVVATFYWRGASSGQETWRPNNVWGHLCD
jgi:hypothetical protein